MLKISVLTFALLFSLPALAAPDAPPPKPASRPTSGVMRYDANGDGVVDRAEWNAGQEARFKELDVNSDGKLAQDELFARTPASGDNVLPTDKQVQRQTAYFQRLDSDKDGFVSKAEFLVQAGRNFARCDLNKDGKIDTAECRQALRRQPTTPARAEQ